jgi:hypothetical protein
MLMRCSHQDAISWLVPAAFFRLLLLSQAVDSLSDFFPWHPHHLYLRSYRRSAIYVKINQIKT